MHITLISACERRAIKRSNALLDSYAIRTGERSWQTPITTEAMRELRAALRRVATRQTAVACYVNEGMRRMRLLWVVGSQDKFGPEGAYPVAYTRRKQPPTPDWLRPVALLARLAGLIHDWGKASNWFQAKLRHSKAPQADPVRHEWLSLLLYRHWRDGQSWPQAWAALPAWFAYPAQDLSERLPWLRQGLSSWRDALEFIVVSHHQLLGAEISNCERHTLDRGPFFRPGQPEARAVPLDAAGELPEALFKEVAVLHQRLDKLLHDKPRDYWWPLALQARAALIFADHKISADPLRRNGQGPLYANTVNDQGQRVLKQGLAEHVQDVAVSAADAAYTLASVRLPALSQEAISRITADATPEGRFAWQNRAAAALETLRQHSQQPVLLLNLAGTGSGKTRMNARAACLLSLSPRVRFAVALNLRSLTLQTGHALSQQLGIGSDEIATVIGSRSLSQLHAAAQQASALDEDENPLETQFSGWGEPFPLPSRLAHLAERQPSLRPVLAAPILVATIDYLIAAGEPQRQGHHVAAWLRVMDSDLILDEIDGYDPTALVAVLRLVQSAARAGRNVICSSATLSLPVARALQRAFSSGVAQRSALHGQVYTGKTVVIDDRLPPSVFSPEQDFDAEYNKHISALCHSLGHERHRLAYRQTIAAPTMTSWLDSIVAAVQRLHSAQQWPLAGGHVSFGLVRVANIKTAVQVAQHLLTALPLAQVACYHARDFLIQRHHKEARLDQLLNRKPGQRGIEQDREILAVLRRHAGAAVPFIVVATPVEEIGRDHDFDWAVIEPSSSQSLVQTAGRVNRHRLVRCEQANIALLDANARAVRRAEGQLAAKAPVFIYPGLESSAAPYPSVFLSKLLAPSLFVSAQHPGDNLDARLRFQAERHPLAALDNNSLEQQLKEPLGHLCPENSPHPVRFPSRRLAEAFYTKYPLRGKESHVAYRVDEALHFQRQVQDGYRCTWVEADHAMTHIPLPRPLWLALDMAELQQLCLVHGIAPTEGLRVDLPELDSPAQTYRFSPGLGFWQAQG